MLKHMLNKEGRRLEDSGLEPNYLGDGEEEQF